jgi:tRNA-uridine 2-sulfurtransferase
MPGKRIAAALSGGVDSAVAAALLLDQGYDVIGITLRLWREGPLSGGPSTKPIHDPTDGARQVAERLGISFHVVDAEVPFKQLIVDRFIAAYGAGCTPNPCLYCNRHIKFGFLLERALALGAQRLATGHYVRTQRARDGTTWQLLKGCDRHKDQSYFLYMLGQKELARATFPLGEWTKDRVRALAQERDLPAAHARESQDLCFVRDGDYRRFLREHAPQIFVPGPILDQDGRQLGRHQGLAQYTIGQRSGIGIAAPEALYVLDLDTQRNALIVGTKQALGRETLSAQDVRWVSGKTPRATFAAEVKIRYRARLAQATVTPLPNAGARVELFEPLRDITPGQGVVFYQDQTVLGGGLISNAL